MIVYSKEMKYEFISAVREALKAISKTPNQFTVNILDDFCVESISLRAVLNRHLSKYNMSIETKLPGSKYNDEYYHAHYYPHGIGNLNSIINICTINFHSFDGGCLLHFYDYDGYSNRYCFRIYPDKIMQFDDWYHTQSTISPIPQEEKRDASDTQSKFLSTLRQAPEPNASHTKKTMRNGEHSL